MIEPQTILVTILGVVLFAIRELTRSKVYVDRARADGDLITEKSYAGALDVLAKIADRTLTVQEKISVSIDNNTTAIRESAAETRGMIAMLDSNTKAVRVVAIAVDDMAGQLPSLHTELKGIASVTSTLKTDIDGSLTHQLGPIVTALTTIGVQLTALVMAVQSKDAEINTRLNLLIEDFKQAEGRLILGLKLISEFNTSSDNHATEQETS